MIVNGLTDPTLRCPQGAGVPEYAQVGDEIYLCPPAECDVHPAWEAGTYEAWCVNAHGASAPLVIVPEIEVWLGFALMLVAIFLLKALADYRRDGG